VYVNGSEGRANFPSAVLAYIQAEHTGVCLKMLDPRFADPVHKDLYGDLKPVFWNEHMVSAFREKGYGDEPLFKKWLGCAGQSLVVFRVLDANLQKVNGLVRWLDQVETFFLAVEKATGKRRDQFIEQHQYEALNFPPAVHLLLNPNVREILNYKK
jgi:hypothetical protein